LTALIRSIGILAITSLLTVVSVSAFAQDAPAPQNQTVSNLTGEAPFLRENDAAMVKMMNDMAAKPTGDVNRDFVAMMLPHHQGAIDMAVAYLRYGNNEQLRRIAQEIIVDQQQEIAAMRLALGDPLPASNAVPTQVDPNDPKTTQSPPEETSSKASTMQMMMKPAN